MAVIVSIGAGAKGRALLQQWHASAHETSDGTAQLDKAGVVLLDASGPAVDDVSQLAPRLAGKIVIDCSNPASTDELRLQPSLGEQLARECPDARIVKA